MNSKSPNRRGFLKGGAALAGLAVGAMPFTSAQTLSTRHTRSAPGQGSFLRRAFSFRELRAHGHSRRRPRHYSGPAAGRDGSKIDAASGFGGNYHARPLFIS